LVLAVLCALARSLSLAAWQAYANTQTLSAAARLL
jgi:hypothetical protein